MKAYIDHEAKRELDLYAENTYYIYDNYIAPTIANLTRKAKAGKYDAEKAIKAWENVLTAAAKMYARDFASADEWCVIFNKATRNSLAVDWEQEYKDEIFEG